MFYSKKGGLGILIVPLALTQAACPPHSLVYIP
jgi:hypothetical protein